MIEVTLKDGSVMKFNKGTSVKDVAENISAGLARVSLAGDVDGNLRDLTYNLQEDCSLNLLTFDDEGGREAYRHTTSHIMAQAVKRLYPDVKLAIGPSIDTDFITILILKDHFLLKN